MKQAITTKYLGPTDTRGGRIRASCDAGSYTMSWNHQYDIETNHRLAAEGLMQKLSWSQSNNLIGGSLGSNKGYVFVLVSKDFFKKD